MRFVYELFMLIGFGLMIGGVFGVEVWVVNDLLINSSLHDPVAFIVLGFDLAFVARFLESIEIAMGSETDDE